MIRLALITTVLLPLFVVGQQAAPSLSVAVTPSVFAKPTIHAGANIRPKTGFLSGGLEFDYRQPIKQKLGAHLVFGFHHILNILEIDHPNYRYKHAHYLADYIGGYLGTGLDYLLSISQKITVQPRVDIAYYMGYTAGSGHGFAMGSEADSDTLSFSTQQPETTLRSYQVSLRVPILYKLGTNLELMIAPSYHHVADLFQPARYRAYINSENHAGTLAANPSRFALHLGVCWTFPDS